jgi:hypothetical protein
LVESHRIENPDEAAVGRYQFAQFKFGHGQADGFTTQAGQGCKVLVGVRFDPRFMQDMDARESFGTFFSNSCST